MTTENRRAKRLASMKSMTGSVDEMEDADLAWWAQVPLADKFQATVELVRDSWYLSGHDGPPPRLDRSVGGVRKLIR
jgi:hypothetical protein